MGMCEHNLMVYIVKCWQTQPLRLSCNGKMAQRKNQDPAPQVEAGREAWGLLFRLLPSVRNHLLTVWAELDLTPAQARLLERLDPDRPVPMTELANALCCDASNVTGLVDKLEARGLIERTAHPDDRRVKMIAVTPAGADLRTTLGDRVSDLPPFIASLSPSEQKTLRDILRKAAGSDR